jgi:hypothetical protein
MISSAVPLQSVWRPGKMRPTSRRRSQRRRIGGCVEAGDCAIQRQGHAQLFSRHATTKKKNVFIRVALSPSRPRTPAANSGGSPPRNAGAESKCRVVEKGKLAQQLIRHYRLHANFAHRSLLLNINHKTTASRRRRLSLLSCNRARATALLLLLRSNVRRTAPRYEAMRAA